MSSGSFQSHRAPGGLEVQTGPKLVGRGSRAESMPGTGVIGVILSLGCPRAPCETPVLPGPGSQWRGRTESRREGFLEAEGASTQPGPDVPHSGLGPGAEGVTGRQGPLNVALPGDPVYPGPPRVSQGLDLDLGLADGTQFPLPVTHDEGPTPPRPAQGPIDTPPLDGVDGPEPAPELHPLRHRSPLQDSDGSKVSRTSVQCEQGVVVVPVQ